MDASHFDNLFEYARFRNLPDDNDSAYLTSGSAENIDPECYLVYFNTLVKKSEDPFFGLHFGAFLNLKALQVVFDISVAVSGIRQLALIWKNYAEASFPLLNVREVEKPGEYSLIFEASTDSQIAGQVMDSIIVIAFRELKLITGIKALSVSLPHEDLSEYGRWFECPLIKANCYAITFHCPADAIATNQKTIKRIEILLPAFLYYLNSLDAQNPSFSHQARLMILKLCEPDCPDIEKVASQFCMTTRTLQRRLQDEHTSFRSLTNELKKELYTYINKGNRLKTVEISSILGYSSSSAFLHALKSWNLT